MLSDRKCLLLLPKPSGTDARGPLEFNVMNLGRAVKSLVFFSVFFFSLVSLIDGSVIKSKLSPSSVISLVTKKDLFFTNDLLIKGLAGLYVPRRGNFLFVGNSNFC